jgi:hypothetical protein
MVWRLQTGRLWHQLGEFETAEACFAKATEYGGAVRDLVNDASAPKVLRQKHAETLFQLCTFRAQTAWALQQTVSALGPPVPQ